jgi:hypothetical protein
MCYVQSFLFSVDEIITFDIIFNVNIIVIFKGSSSGCYQFFVILCYVDILVFLEHF